MTPAQVQQGHSDSQAHPAVPEIRLISSGPTNNTPDNKVLENTSKFESVGYCTSTPERQVPQHSSSSSSSPGHTPTTNQGSPGTSNNPGLESDSEFDSSTSSSSGSLFGPEDGLRSSDRLTFGALEAETDRRETLEISDDELVEQPFPRSSGPSSSQRFPPAVNKAARAPFNRDDGPLPTIIRERFVPRLPEEHSEVTDFGGELHYRDRKLRSRKTGRSKPTRGRNSLQTRLFEALEPLGDTTKDKGFFPLDQLPLLLTEQSVSEELERHLHDICGPDEISKYVRTICSEKRVDSFEDGVKPKTKTYRKIFATLVLIEKTPAIRKFIREDLNDCDLPLIRSPTGIGMRRSRIPDRELKCFQSGWSALQIRNFEDWQWTTLAPFFAKGEQRKDVHHYPLQQRVILPFIFDQERDAVERDLFGGGGRVFKAIIHPDHHNFHTFFGCPRASPQDDGDELSNCVCSFAIKCLHSPDKESFKKEVDMLKRFSNNAHPHLISLLATYEQNRTFFLIFPRAESDLLEYWKRTQPPAESDLDGVCWVAEQCLGIAKGVLKIHKYESSNSRLHPNIEEVVNHGDIKPENVLWFQDTEQNGRPGRGTLKLSDFGLADVNSRRTASRRFHSQTGVTCNYRAPECDLRDQGGKGREYDMWTLGCLYLEFVTWLVGGFDLLDQFTHDRLSVDMRWYEMNTDTFFELKRDSETGKEYATVKGSVINAMDDLRANPRCTLFVRDFLELIQTGLLVVKGPNRHVMYRLSIEQTHVKLADMVRKCKAMRGYACNRCSSFAEQVLQDS
ncbi:hypothetical protein B0T14DRAFT_439006 [Immersiella caudata]|uniref:Protein kinase domain-containing protein n=1 Tax=Immersiella caudata TaxID=314043 RepID=A0AA39W4P5_9PEZI|nr:hypothetical protein B0T14DRAFT_439006 [Immersiella caudata]